MAAKKTKPKPKPAAPLYDWGDGRKVHTIPKTDHAQNVEARGYGLDLNAPVSAPLSNRQAYGLAQQSADLQYQPQIEANKSLQRSVPEWYANYQTKVAASQAAAQAYAAPLLQQAQQGVTNAGATAPGLDASSPQYATEQQAAQGRQSIAQLGYDTLAAIPAATYGYMGEQASTAARELPGVRADLTNQYGQLQGQRGAAVAESYGGIRQNEQNARIAYDTLDLNTGKAKADVDLGRGVDPVTGKPLPSKPPTGYGAGAPGMNSYGYTYDEWSKLSDAAKAKARAGKGKDTSAADKKAADVERKRVEGVRAKSGEFASRISDAVGDWDMLKREPVQKPDTEKIDPDSKKKVKVPGGTRPANVDEIRRAMRSKGYTPMEIHIALLRRVGKPLDQAAIDYMHSKGYRIPRDWLPGKRKTSTGVSNEKSRGGTKQDPYGSGPGHH